MTQEVQAKGRDNIEDKGCEESVELRRKHIII